MERAKKVIVTMTMGDAVDHIPCLLNLMTLADVVPDGTTVYNTDTGEFEELVPMIKEAHKDLEWLLGRAAIAEGDSDTNQKDAGSNVNFKDGFISHAKEVDDAAKAFDRVAGVFHDWLSSILDDTSIEDIVETLKCGDPAIGEAEKNLPRGILAAKRAANRIAKSAADGNGVRLAVIGFQHD